MPFLQFNPDFAATFCSNFLVHWVACGRKVQICKSFYYFHPHSESQIFLARPIDPILQTYTFHVRCPCSISRKGTNCRSIVMKVTSLHKRQYLTIGRLGLSVAQR